MHDQHPTRGAHSSFNEHSRLDIYNAMPTLLRVLDELRKPRSSSGYERQSHERSVRLEELIKDLERRKVALQAQQSTGSGTRCNRPCMYRVVGNDRIRVDFS